jgi:hypothetical protein
MRNIRRTSWWLGVILLMVVAPALAEPKVAATTQSSDATHFMRFEGDSKKGGTLQTADITYQNDAGVKVRLVAAVHIADTDYYKQLNESFRGCDAVLYEMVKPKEMETPKPGESNSDISKLQRFLKTTLDLDFQLDAIDYDAKNFVHADMDAESFQKMQEQRGESFASIMLSSMLQSLSNPGATASYDDEASDSLDLMTRPDGSRQFKLILARRMGDIEHDAMGLGALNGTVLLTERNKAATKVLRETIKAGKKNLAVFYGAAHMTDLADRLDLMGFKPVATTWRQAWDVHIRDNEPSAFQKLMQMAQKAATQPAK